MGVTVVEAVGHGRERGITHEYRGRVFESRFLPKALLTFVVADELADAVAATIADAARSGNDCGDGLVWTTPVYNVTHNRTGLPLEHGRRRRHEEQRPPHRGEHALGRRRGRARDVHAGRLRLPRGRADADEERRPHRGQERPHLRASARSSTGRSASGSRSATAARSSGRTASCPSVDSLLAVGAGAVLVLHDDPGRGRLHVRGRLRGRLARDRLGRDGRAGEALGLLRLRRRLHAHLLDHVALGLGRRLAVRPRDAGLRRLDRRPLPGRARGAGRRAAARPADREVRGRPREPDPRPQHPLRRPRHVHPLVRLVRLQPGLDARGRHRARRSASSPTSR